MSPASRWLALTSALAASPLHGQVVDGRVLDRGSDRPLAGATVTLLAGAEPRGSVRTDSVGVFAIRISTPGTYRLTVQRDGGVLTTSREFHVQAPGTTHVELRVLTRIVLLEPVVAIAPPRRLPGGLNGFYQRAEQSRGGQFITRDRIDVRGAARTSDLLRDLAGFSFALSRRGGTSMRTRGCEPAVWIDGQPLPATGLSLDELVQPHDVEGIEVYSGPASLPAAFVRRGAFTCGAVLIWTRYRA